MTKDLIERLEARLRLAEQHGPLSETREVYIPSSDLPAILSALRREEWQGIETAPKGAPSFDVGCREPSEWFLAGRPRRKTLLVRRRAWPQDDGWEDQFGNHYAADAFTHWRPLPPPPTKGTDHE